MTGATALVTVSGGHHSVFAVLLLGLLTMVMAHALVVEIQRQARRRSQLRWYRTDTVNTVLLACLTLIAAATTTAPFIPLPMRALGALLALGYAGACVYFVVERRRAVTVASVFRPEPEPAVDSRDPLADSAPSV